MMNQFIQTFLTLTVNPPTIDTVVPKDLTAIMPSKQIQSQCLHDRSQQSQSIKNQVNKLIRLLEGTKPLQQGQNYEKGSSVKEIFQDEKEQSFKEETGKDENIDYFNRNEKRQKISQLVKVQYKRSPHPELTPYRRQSVKVRKITPTVKKVEKSFQKPKIELLSSKDLHQEEKRIIHQLSQLQTQLESFSQINPSPVHKNNRKVPSPLTQDVKRVKVDLTPTKKYQGQLKMKTKQLGDGKGKRSKRHLLTDRIEKAMR